MPGGAQQIQLLRALDDHDSLYELALELPKLGKSLHQNLTLRDQRVEAASSTPEYGPKFCSSHYPQYRGI